MSFTNAVAEIESKLVNPRDGLPDDVFQFISRLTPLVNVDLLIKDKHNRTLLAWRDDQYAGKGWHIPGGIVRYKESLEHRVQQVAKNEIGQTVHFNALPIAFNTMISSHETRGHFVSLLYECSITSSFQPNNIDLTASDSGYLLWHDSCPSNLVKSHEMYRDYITKN